MKNIGNWQRPVFFLLCCSLVVLLLLFSSLTKGQAAPPSTTAEIHLVHQTIQTNELDNLLQDLIQYGDDSDHNKKTSALSNLVLETRARAATKRALFNTQQAGNKNDDDVSLQLMLQLKDHSHRSKVEAILGMKLGHVIPPQTYAIYDNVNELSKKLKANTDQINEYISWIGHMKPEYKTKLNFEKMSALFENETIAASITHSDVIELYVILSSNNNNEPTTETEQFASSVKQYLALTHNNRQFSVGTNDNRSGSATTTVLDRVVSSLVAPSKMLVKVTPDVANNVLQFLKEQEQVHWVERKLPMTLLNDAANQIMQGDGSAPKTSSLSDLKPLWAQSITGRGEVVGVGDTGIDYDSCFFRDPEWDVSFNLINTDHRKIIGYYTVTKTRDGKTIQSDKQDFLNGHGTHVVGSIAGNMYSNASNFDEMSRFAGVAKDAKIFFTDIYNPRYDELLVPDDLNADYFPIPYNSGGVRIHTNSWGCSIGVISCTYDCICKWAVDTNYGKAGQTIKNDFCVENFGNDCCRICNEYNSRSLEVDQFVHEHDDMLILFAAGNVGNIAKTGTISSPATAKNALSVGASHTSNENFLESVLYEDFSEIFALLRSNGIDVKTTEECCRAVGRTSQQTNIIRNACCPSYIQKTYAENAQYYERNNVATFSSRGPTFDGRIKPDVVAPGFSVVSMRSDGDPTSEQCGFKSPNGKNDAALLTMKGTSMATPLVAGAAALVRQYYREKGIASNPSGALLKATLIHSGQQLTGSVSLNGQSLLQKIPTGPNNFSGFGLVSLSKVLEFADSAFKLFVYDRTPIANSERRVHCFKMVKEGAFKATLTWYDPPASPVASSILVNDLNLDAFYYRNGSKTSTRAPGNDNEDGDTKNTVEQISISSIPSAYIVAVTVTAERVSQGNTQNYALVVTGAVESVESCWVPPARLHPRIIMYIIVGVTLSAAVLLVLVSLLVIGIIKYRNYKQGNGDVQGGGRRLGSGHFTLQDEDEMSENENSTATQSNPYYTNRNNQ